MLSMITGKFQCPKSHERIQPISGLKRARRLSAVSTIMLLMLSLGARRRALPKLQLIMKPKSCVSLKLLIGFSKLVYWIACSFNFSFFVIS